MTESEMLAQLAAQALDDKKGMDVQILDMRGLQSAPASFFVIASGNVPSHVSAMSDHVHEVVKKAMNLNPSKVEGYNNAEWILMDYFDVAKVMNVYRFFEMMATELVTDPKEADIVVTDDRAVWEKATEDEAGLGNVAEAQKEWIRSFDFERFLALMNQK